MTSRTVDFAEAVTILAALPTHFKMSARCRCPGLVVQKTVFAHPVVVLRSSNVLAAAVPQEDQDLLRAGRAPFAYLMAPATAAPRSTTNRPSRLQRFNRTPLKSIAREIAV